MRVRVILLVVVLSVSPGKAWHSDWFWSHWQLRFNEQLLQFASLVHTCSFLTGHSGKFFALYSTKGRRREGGRYAIYMGHSNKHMHFKNEEIRCRRWWTERQDERSSGAPCCETYRAAVAGGRDALLVVTPLAAIGIGCTAGTVWESVAPFVHCD